MACIVETKNQGGGLTDGPFNLVVVCESPDTKFAVVGYGSELVRASDGTTLSNLGDGRFHVTFPQPVSACAFVATVGDPGSALVYNPSGVYTGSIRTWRGPIGINGPEHGLRRDQESRRRPAGRHLRSTWAVDLSEHAERLRRGGEQHGSHSARLGVDELVQRGNRPLRRGDQCQHQPGLCHRGDARLGGRRGAPDSRGDG